MERTAGLRLLELLVFGATAVGCYPVARAAVTRLGIRTNELFLDAGMSDAFLRLRPEGELLRRAAFLAFDGFERELAVACAESGRMKLLAATASGGEAVWAEPDPGPAHVLAGAPDELLHALDAPAPATIARALTAVGGDAGVRRIARGLVDPWIPLSSVVDRHDDPDRGGERPIITDQLWTGSLREPTMTWTTAQLGDGQILAYPFVKEDAFGLVLVNGTAVQSIEVPASVLIPELGDSTLGFAAGLMLHDSAAEVFAFTGLPVAWDEVLIVDWDPAGSAAANDFKNGWSQAATASLLDQDAAPEAAPIPAFRVPTLLPSARFLPRSPAAARSGRTLGLVTIVGDPTGDLVGPWYERSMWRSLHGDHLTELMVGDATREAVLQALQESDLVVISGHTVSDTTAGLNLADGPLDTLDLLRSLRRCAPEVILSCCSAGTRDAALIAEELLGLTSALLAVGAQRVVSPIVPVGDTTAAALGLGLAERAVAGQDLRAAYTTLLGEFEQRTFGGWDVELPVLDVDELGPACPHDPAEFATAWTLRALRIRDTIRKYAVFGS